MFNEELRSLIFQVITSWQVIAVTIVIILYIILVNYVARTHKNWRYKASVSKRKKEMADVISAPEDDDLGLEEKSGD